MFTGFVEHLGRVRQITLGVDAARLTIDTDNRLGSIALGDSIAVNGACLTVASLVEGVFEADVMRESLIRTTLGELSEGDVVNLEAAARLDTRLGGHLVQGHVDAVGAVSDIQATDAWTLMRVCAPRKLLPYFVSKGSVAVDGVSLTIVEVFDAGSSADPAGFSVSLIPTTLTHTTLGFKVVGDNVNLECDVIAKYVERSVAAHMAVLAGSLGDSDDSR